MLASDAPGAVLFCRGAIDGGGGTTSLAPKILPMMLLMNDPPVCEGGGGTTDRLGSATLPGEARCMSEVRSAEGGGATTCGAGIFSRAVREVARSGAETGGGTTFSFVICTGACDICRLATFGAGGMTFVARAIPVRARSAATVGAGATTEAFSEGSAMVRSRETRGAGGITAGVIAGATSL